MPDTSAPVVTFMVTYLVGSRNEVTGTTGATHLLEHLMFKGSRRFNDANGNSFEQYLETVGGDQERHDLARPHQLLRGGSEGRARRLRRDRGGPDAQSLAARRGPAARDDRRPQRVRAGRERSARGAREGDLGHRLHGASVPSLDDRLAQRHRERADREAEGVLRHVLLAEQRDGLGHRRLPARGGPGTRPPYFGAIPRSPQPIPRSTRRSPSRPVRGA